MLINFKKLTMEEYLDATENGGGFLFDYENYRFIESTDIFDKPRFLIVKKNSEKNYDDIDPRYEELDFVELNLQDFHNMCSLYILALQEGCKKEALNSLGNDLSTLFGKN